MALLDISLSHAPSRRGSLLDMARTMIAVQRQRAALRRLDDTRLADLGLTRDAAMTEANRPIWDVPATWVR